MLERLPEAIIVAKEGSSEPRFNISVSKMIRTSFSVIPTLSCGNNAANDSSPILAAMRNNSNSSSRFTARSLAKLTDVKSKFSSNVSHKDSYVSTGICLPSIANKPS